MPIELAALPDDPVALRELVADAAGEIASLRAEIDKLHLLIRKFQRHRFGARSEQIDPDQLALAIEDLEQTEAAATAAAEAAMPTHSTDAAASPRRRRQRTMDQLPESLPQVEVVVDRDDKTCACCGGPLHQVGETVSRMLDIVPALFRVKVLRRPR